MSLDTDVKGFEDWHSYHWELPKRDAAKAWMAACEAKDKEAERKVQSYRNTLSILASQKNNSEFTVAHLSEIAEHALKH